MKNLVKAIVFDEFNPKVDKLSQILMKSEYGELTDETLKEIEDKLQVTNFEEFLKKFAPIVYPTVTERNIIWGLEESYPGQKGIKLDMSYKPLKLLIELMEKRRKSNKSNLEFDWQDAFQTILPTNMVREARDIRGRLEYLYRELNTAVGEKYDDLVEAIFDCREEIRKQYEDNVMNLLPLAIEDCRVKLKALEPKVDENGVVDDSVPMIGEYRFTEKGVLEFKSIDLEKENKDNIIQNQLEMKTIQNWIELDYDAYVEDNNIEENRYVKQLIVDSYSNGKGLVVDENRDELKENYKNLVGTYKENIKSSFEGLNDIFQKILGIKAFFDQNTSKEKIKLIVTNDNIATLVNIKDNFEKYLRIISPEKYKEDLEIRANFWLAIVPGIITEAKKEGQRKKRDLNEGVSRAKSSILQDEKGTTISNTKEIVSLLSSYRIFTFVNFKTMPIKEEKIKYNSNTFEALQKFGIEKYKKELEKMSFENSSYIIPCFPNFCIADGGYFNLDIKIDENDDMLSLKGVYVDASFVAAGLVASYLNPKILKSTRFNFEDNEIDMRYPGVRINLEDIEIAKKISTTMAKESNIGIVKRIKEEIKDFGKGFIFICDEDLGTMYPYLCRSINKKRLYRVMTLYYIKNSIVEFTNNNKEKIKNIKNDIKVKNWGRDNAGKINKILNEANDLEVGEDYKIKIKFEEEYEEIEIKVEEAE
ncbi:hypothetical protein [uncultured Fusobacterium sp.]|uniref:hypothetical protein n=1 Tax=uncultured Fusobacterium sp. TaxID=159267 RepID=UPI0025F4B433|nr:hypothetical protein [uncultured Fusobacterium sp.]